VETVAWIAGRTDLVCGMFLLGAFVLYRRGRLGNLGWARLAAPVLFALALFSKEMAATLPALVFADRWWDGERRGRLRAAATATAPFLLVLALYLVARNTVLGPPGPPLYTLTPPEHAATALFVLARYATLLLLPLGLDAHYPYQPVAGLFAPLALFGAVMLVTVLGLAVRFARLQPRVALWTAWILVGLTPVMGFGRFGDVLLADRFLYLPSVGLALLAAWAFRSLAGSAPSLRSARAPVASAVALILLFAGLSAARVRVWRDDLTLFTEMAHTSPDSPLVRTNLGLARYGRGEYHTAIEEFRHALHVTPDYALARNNLAAALEREGRLHEAFVEYQAALRHAPGLAEAQANAAILEVRLGRPQDGLGRLRRLVREQGDYLPGRYALAFTLNELGRNDEAFRETEWVLSRDADYTQAYYLAGKIRFEQERLDEAAGFMRQFLDRWREDDPFTAAARRVLAEAEAEGAAPGSARS
jgi:tetratricopeptide (TPR) repeat protein